MLFKTVLTLEWGNAFKRFEISNVFVYVCCICLCVHVVYVCMYTCRKAGEDVLLNPLRQGFSLTPGLFYYGDSQRSLGIFLSLPLPLSPWCVYIYMSLSWYLMGSSSRLNNLHVISFLVSIMYFSLMVPLSVTMDILSDTFFSFCLESHLIFWSGCHTTPLWLERPFHRGDLRPPGNHIFILRFISVTQLQL